MDSTQTLSQATTDYEGFNDAVVARLDETFGAQPWETDASVATKARCGDDHQGVKAILGDRWFRGAYEAGARDRVRDLVIAVGKENGFRDPELVVEKPDYLKIVAEDDRGGRYTFVTAKNTVLSTWTGCSAPD